MEKDTFKTEAIFRVWKDNDCGETIYRKIIAIFPYDIESHTDYDCCSSYMNIGQHSGADYPSIIERTRPATPAEYLDLQKHLTNAYGYDLLIIQRRNRNKAIQALKELKTLNN